MIKLDISFATDSNLFSKAVEQLRKEGVPLLDGNIKVRYELLRDGGSVDVVATEFPVEEVAVPDVVAPKTRTLKKK